ncbi:MAG: hypothetical protein AAB583_00220 [Patescibacteria group bacterium]
MPHNKLKVQSENLKIIRSPETSKNSGEKIGETSRNLGIMGGVISLIIESANLFVGGVGLAVSGEIFRRLCRKHQQKIA